MSIDFFIIGPQRTGTSWLDKLLRQNPNVCLPQHVKETFFFDQNFEKGLGYYLQHFGTLSNHRTLIEVAPTYFGSISAAERINSFFPACSVIIIVRNPIELAFSLFLHHLAKGRVSDELLVAIEQMPEIIENGKYKNLVTNWRSVFEEDRIHFLNFSEMEINPNQYYHKLLTIIGAPSQKLTKSNLSQYGAATNPKYRNLARLVAKGASYLRKRNFHVVAQFGKKIGLRKVYAGKGVRQISTEEYVFLNEYYQEDFEFIRRDLGYELMT